MALKDEIRARRLAAGMAQFDLANAMGVHLSTIYNWENGKTHPTYNKLRLMARVLGISEQDLLKPTPGEEKEDSKNVP